MVVTPQGDVWVTDPEKGVCRIENGRLVFDGVYCVSAPIVHPEEEAVIALPPPGPAPSGAHGLVFHSDPVTGRKFFFVGEGTSKGAGIWRMEYSPSSRAIAGAERIANVGRSRVFALALHPDGHIDFNGRDSGTILRLPNAATATAATPLQAVGSSATAGLTGMAYLGTTLYLAEPAGVTKIENPGPTASPPIPVPGLPGGIANALVADTANNRLYAGTANPNGFDQVDVLDGATGAVSTYDTGFSFIAGLGVRTAAPGAGAVFVGDDPSIAAGNPEAVGLSRIFEIPLRPTRPSASTTITSGPAAVIAATSVTFTYETVDAARFDCRFTTPSSAGTWAPCDPGVATATSGTSTFAGLADGSHVFEVRAVDVSDPANPVNGPAARRTVVIDTRPPKTSFGGSDTSTEGEELRAFFYADELFVRFTCALDGAAPTDCTSPLRVRGLAVGEHRLSVRGTDLAGNVGEVASRTYKVQPPPPPPPTPPPPPPPPPPAPAPPAAAIAPVAPPVAFAVVRARSGPATTLFDCERIAQRRTRSAGTARAVRRNGSWVLEIRARAPASARYVKLTLRDARTSPLRKRARGRRSLLKTRSVSPLRKRARARARGRGRLLRTRAITTRLLPAGSGTRTYRVVISRQTAKRVRSSRYLTAVAYGTCPSHLGAWAQLVEPKRAKAGNARR